MKGLVGWLAVLALLVLVIGCGGGGGGGGTSSGGTTGGVHALQVTGYGQASQMLDTRNLLVGDVVQLNITARDKNNNIVVLTANGWTTNAPSTVATISSTGVLTAIGASAATYTVSVRYNGATFKANLVVSAPQDLIVGSVTNGTNSVEDVIVDILDNTGKQVGSAYTARDGTFRASVPATATKFTIDTSLADPGGVDYFYQYAYGNLQYLDGSQGTSCPAKLPLPLSATVPTTLPGTITIDIRGLIPPPPPTGCLG